MAVPELTGDGQTGRAGTDDNDVMAVPAVTEDKLHVSNTSEDAIWFTGESC